jgi:hypothetical protein
LIQKADRSNPLRLVSRFRVLTPTLSHVLCVCALFAGSGCKRDAPAEPKPTEKPVPANFPGTKPPEAEHKAGLRWSEPAGWKRLDSAGSMRKASYEVPPAEGDSDPAGLGIFHFGSQGGTIDANIDRWVSQFQGASREQLKRTQRSSGGLVQHIVEIERGTFASGMPGGPTAPKEGWALLGAIVETPSGPWFFKLVGPQRTVQQARNEFFRLLDSTKI